MATTKISLSYPKFKVTYGTTAAPLAGGLVYTYQAGTSTPQQTFTDNTGLIANANPIVLDANGEANVWIANNTSYKFIIQLPDGTVLSTTDNIVGPFNPLAGPTVFGGNLQINDFDITDSNDNRYIDFTTTSSAVNYLTLTNSATGLGPTLGVGGETNVPLNITTKGTGVLTLTSGSNGIILNCSSGVVDITSGSIKLNSDQNITDSSGNLFIDFVKTASAANGLKFTNNITLNPAKISNSETNAGLTITSSGALTIKPELSGGSLVIDAQGTSFTMLNGTNPIEIAHANCTTTGGGASPSLAATTSTFSGLMTFSAAAQNLASSTIASAATVNIGAATANTLSVSGTTTITAFDTIQAGTLRNLIFEGILTLTHNGTSLILPGAANITTAAGDTARMLSLGSGNWRCLNYQRASGGIITSATAAEQEAATSTTAPVTPSIQQRHPSAAKAFVKAATNGASTIAYNIATVTDTGTGIVSFTYTTNFSGANNYAVQGSCQTADGSARWVGISGTTAPTTSGCEIRAYSDNATVADPDSYQISWFGDQ